MSGEIGRAPAMRGSGPVRGARWRTCVALWLGCLGGWLMLAAGAAAGDRVIPLVSGTLLETGSDAAPVAIGHLPQRRLLEPRRFRRFTLVMPFELRDTAAAPLWAVYFLTLNDGGRIRVNGEVIGEAPTSTPSTAVLNVRPYMFEIPAGVLRRGTNQLALEWGTHDTLQQLAATFVGPSDLVRADYERRLFWQNTMAQAGFDFALVSAALLLGIYSVRRREPRYLLMALTSLGWAVVCVAYFLPRMPAALYPSWHLLRLAGIATAACCTWLFMMHEVDPGERRYTRLCIGLAALGPLGYLVNFLVYDSLFSGSFEGGWGAALLLAGLYPLARLARSLLRRWRWRHGVLLLAALSGLLAGVADILHMSTGASVFGGIGYSAQAVSPIWFVTIVLVLVKDFARSLARERAQAQVMAVRLREQQQQLQALHERDQRRERERAALQERQRIMQDIHDGLGSQLVSSLALSERGELDARQTSALLRDCIDDLRLAIDSLAAGQGGFAVMAGNLRFRMTPRLRAAGITLAWHSELPEAEDLVTPAQTLPLLRILQESLGNALRHAGAHRITVTLRTLEGALQLLVQDDGNGFDAATMRPGKGISGMERRARDIGARFAVTSTLTGTTVEVLLPGAARAG